MSSVPSHQPRGRRQHYGIVEIADSLRIDRQLVDGRRGRRSRGRPQPDAELAAGPGLAGTIEPWMSAIPSRSRSEDPSVTYLAVGDSSVLPAQALRRCLRLSALLLEVRLRPCYPGEP